MASSAAAAAAIATPPAARRMAVDRETPAWTRYTAGAATATSRGARWKVVSGCTAAKTTQNKANPSEYPTAETEIRLLVAVSSIHEANRPRLKVLPEGVGFPTIEF